MPPKARPPRPPPTKVMMSATTPAPTANDTAPTTNQAITATTPPVTSDPGTLPSTLRSTPPTASARMNSMGANCRTLPVLRMGELLASGKGSPSTTRMI